MKNPSMGTWSVFIFCIETRKRKKWREKKNWEKKNTWNNIQIDRVLHKWWALERIRVHSIISQSLDLCTTAVLLNLFFIQWMNIFCFFSRLFHAGFFFSVLFSLALFTRFALIQFREWMDWGKENKTLAKKTHNQISLKWINESNYKTRATHAFIVLLLLLWPWFILIYIVYDAYVKLNNFCVGGRINHNKHLQLIQLFI